MFKIASFTVYMINPTEDSVCYWDCIALTMPRCILEVSVILKLYLEVPYIGVGIIGNVNGYCKSTPFVGVPYYSRSVFDILIPDSDCSRSDQGLSKGN